MVFVNNKKFACESCIKGHRSSSCSHTDRPLFEVKKKGRPVSQCEKCRALRQSKKVHSKCNCHAQEDKPPKLPVPPGRKPPRFIPIAPALPNGIRDVIQAFPPSTNPRQRVDILLNPCSCRNPAWDCKCLESSNNSQSSTGLATLAQAAALCCSTEATTSRKSFRSPSSVQLPSQKRAKHVHHNHNNTPGPELPPFLFDTSSPSPSANAVDFGFMPPINEIASLAGTGCTCGVECSCPGCVEHRGTEHADPEREDCVDGPCGTCVDNHQGIGLPNSSISLDSGHTSSRMIDQFFARAAALPAPPTNRKMGMGIQLDPSNIMIYPTVAIETKERGVPFGLISIPKLECCGGNCKCPTGDCSCGKSCHGSCLEYHGSSSVTLVDSPTVRVIAAPTRTCCSK
ncbi:copper fist DNA binding domain-containing protein [Rhodocollybia butyracea]|uniref:Copper fist DNA binding domain-containing protein n=1 Tax=Rhodocollybia butyracea TaxID=206335 RepID=A0A9P5Q313_9AGAR|nr:copper fist DNA binding domain-containing protein [Rhodocollybia butyracea]